MTHTRKVTRNKFRPTNGVDEKGERRTKVGDDKQVTNTPELEGLIVEITLPTTFHKRTVPGKGDRAAIDYQEYHIPVTDGYVKVNSFVGEEAAGTTLIAKVKVGEALVKKRGKESIRNYYLKVESTDEMTPTHKLEVDGNGLKTIEVRSSNDGRAHTFLLSDVNPTLAGGIIVTEL